MIIDTHPTGCFICNLTYGVGQRQRLSGQVETVAARPYGAATVRCTTSVRPVMKPARQ